LFRIDCTPALVTVPVIRVKLIRVFFLRALGCCMFLFCQFIAEVSGQNADIAQQILEANPILEAFGNVRSLHKHSAWSAMSVSRWTLTHSLLESLTLCLSCLLSAGQDRAQQQQLAVWQVV
jgi:hypothetical protein